MRKTGIRRVFHFFNEVITGFSRDNCPQAAGAIAYFTSFALPPLLVFVLTVMGLVVDPQSARGVIDQQLREFLGAEGAVQVRVMIANANRIAASSSTPALLLGIGALLFSVSGAFLSLQNALNFVWKVQPDPRQGLRNLIFPRLVSLGLVITIVFLLLVSLIISALLAAFGDLLARFLPAGFSGFLLQAGDRGLTFIIATLLFAAVYRILPDARIEWGDVWVGAGFTALLFEVARALIGFYIGRANPGDVFGAAGSLALVLLWIYFSALILLLGAEFTRVWARHRGREILPVPGAMRVRWEIVHGP